MQGPILVCHGRPTPADQNEASTEPASSEPPSWLRRRASDEGAREEAIQAEDRDSVRTLFSGAESTYPEYMERVEALMREQAR